uniref:Type I cytokine receptor cytokine-binding domain-containing protein n=1 Tax=Callorhinchus milii TaxID=7868 RepID=A0A4W3JHC4_CALMI|eukprot:gi/632947821/ref/XP_007889256.1/ PREDICTED: interleukin-3 receptor subunit alpha isoform X1 [Callorhinchus milii]
MQLLQVSLLMAALWLLPVNGVPIMSLKERVEMNQPTDLRLTPQRLGEFMFTWTGNLSGLNRTDCKLYYKLCYRHLDSKEESSVLVKTHHHLVHLELYRGAYARVKLLDRNQRDEISSNWTEMTFVPLRKEFASIENLSCVFYNIEYMNCTWDISEIAPQDSQFVLFYREDEQNDTHTCEKYHTQLRRNIGCYSQRYNGSLFSEGFICVAETSNPEARPHCRMITPSSFYILNPPMNFKLKSPSHMATWELGEDYSYHVPCYTFQINIIDWRGNTSKVENVSSTRFAINTNPVEGFSVQVRATMNYNCYESSLWSKWSRTITRKPEAMECSHSAAVMLSVICFVFMTLPLAFIFRRYRLWEKLYQPIPDPKQMFKGLYENYNGDFQNWIKSLPMTEKNEECIPATVKEEESFAPEKSGMT